MQNMDSKILKCLFKISKYKEFNVTLIPEDMVELERLYIIAKNDNQDTFWFKDQEMDVGYVKYLLQYLKKETE